ncbi:MAG TPA: thaumatin family protein [Steroidobacteraceae bacterium]|nr:thaumatin family protein [Steroidobacteraceae bacterium]
MMKNLSEVGSRRVRGPFAAFVFLLFAVLVPIGGAVAAEFTVVNKCSYTVFPGIFPATYQNGGWQMAPGTSVNFTLNSGWIGRIWGRTNCNSASPAVCSTGSCGGTGLQCAGTTGVAGTSLAEFNLNANGTDWYDVSYVDGFDNPIGISVSNGSCNSPNACTTAPLTNCPANLRHGNECLSPCTVDNTDQFCCRGAFGTQATCVVANWPTLEASYVTDIHNSCPGEYAYAYDDATGLHTCPTGSSYTVTFCPDGAAQPPPPSNLNGKHAIIPQSVTGSRLDDYSASTATGNTIDIWGANGTGAQSWVLSNAGVVPAGSYNIAVSFGAYCVTASAPSSGSPVNLQPCNGSAGQAWSAVPSGSGYALHPASNPSLCMDVFANGNANGTPVIVWTCNGGANEQWAIN